MLSGKLLKCIPIFLGFSLISSSGGFVGVNIGTDVSNLPSPSDTVAILRSNGISHVRLYDADSSLLRALASTGIDVIVSVKNEDILKLGESPSNAASWVNTNIIPYFPATNISVIAVGSEVLSSSPTLAPVLVPAMNYLHQALVSSQLNSKIKVSAPQPFEIIPNPFPPSAATFNASLNSTIFQLLQFLKNTNSSFMINAYPYYGYTIGDGIFPLEYALFQPLSSVNQIVDSNTLFHYTNMLDAMIDAVYYSIGAFNVSGIPVVVSETGWPSFGGVEEPEATVKNAETFTNNLIIRISEDSGPPSHPLTPINAYIYELFNEDKSPGPISERNWGLFLANGSRVYGANLGNSKAKEEHFCVARSDADRSKLQSGLDWACGRGGADCSAIQSGGVCFLPNTLSNHASYAFNDYYQKQSDFGGTCDFNGVAMTTADDPSHGSCLFIGISIAERPNPASFSQGPAGSPRGLPGTSHVHSPCWSFRLIIMVLLLIIRVV